MYDHKQIEQKWRKKWEEDKIYKTNESADKPKFYVLDMFPYPSGAGLHVGHPKGYIATDVVARFKMLNGFNVLHPMGWDAFGLPAENYALKIKTHPRIATEKNVARFKKQLELFGLTYDWDREINTTDPNYYKWTQWIFLQMFKKGLAYESHEPINWCPSCKTGLANEDLEEGKCERCGSEIEQKPMRQWVLKITDYAEKLLDGLKDLDWEDSIIEMQKNWIGRSEGALIKFSIFNFQFSNKSQNLNPKTEFIEIFTTRPDTIFGATYLVLAPEHPLISACKFQISNFKEVESYINNARKKTNLERAELNKEKTGVELKGVKAINPASNEEIPIYIADYVMTGYGAGAIMAVPAHDERDFEFAKKYELPIKTVVLDNSKTPENLGAFGGSEGYYPQCRTGSCHPINKSIANNKINVKFSYKQGAEPVEGLEPSGHGMTTPNLHHATGKTAPAQLYQKAEQETNCFSGDGVNINSDFLNGLSTKEAKQKITEWLEQRGLGKRKTNYKLRDWVFSRQRYWGEPIPLVHCESCKNKKLNFIILHGYGGSSQANFFPWVKKELENRGHRVFCPELPNTDQPNVAEQVDYVLNNTELDENAVIIGHSLGGVVALKLAEQIKTKINKIVLVDSFVEPKFNDIARPDVEQSADWNFDFKKIKNSANEFIVLADSGYSVIPKEQTIKMAKLLNIEPIFSQPEDWHFCGAQEPIIAQLLDNQGVYPVSESELPLELPEVEHYEPSGTGESPLAGIEEWVNTTCPKCGGPAKRETNTMPQWAGSCWYYLRYIDPNNDKKLVDLKKEKYWQPVDLYVGGAEHATRHLIYARFWHKFLYEIGSVSTPEPFKKLQHVGLIMAEDGRKMSKRWNNVINPDDVIEKHGADAMRIYEMFMGPFENAIAWSTESLIGARRFLEKVCNLEPKIENRSVAKAMARRRQESNDNKKLESLLHKTIKKVTDDIENFKFNTAISALMILANEMEKEKTLFIIHYSLFIILLSPFAPHLAEELWDKLGNKESIFSQSWPKYDESLAKDKEIELVVQVNGKVRDKIIVSADISEEEAKEKALALEKIKKWLDGKEPKKIIYVKGKLVSIVI